MNVDKIILGMKDFDPIYPDLQIELCREIGQIVNDQNREIIINTLIGLLDKKFPACTRAHAVEELGKIKSEKSKEALRVCVNDPYRLVRSYAVRALGEYRDKNLIDDLKKAGLKDNEFFGVMAEAAEALGKICKDVLQGRHDDEECTIIMKETIPLIQKKAKERRDIDPRYPLRVGREAYGASEELKMVLQMFNNRLNKFFQETSEAQLEEIRKNVSKEVNDVNNKMMALVI